MSYIKFEYIINRPSDLTFLEWAEMADLINSGCKAIVVEDNLIQPHGWMFVLYRSEMIADEQEIVRAIIDQRIMKLTDPRDPGQ